MQSLARIATALAVAIAGVMPAAADQAPADGGAPSTTSAPNAEQPLPQNIEFRVLLDGDDVGHHRISFSRVGAQVAADIDSAFNVTMAGFTVFEFNQRSREVWQNGALQSIRATTVANDTQTALNVDRVGDVLTIDGDKFKGEGPGNLIPASWWSPAIVTQTQMLGQSGEIVPIAVTKVGPETIEAGGSTVQAMHYLVKGRIDMNLWYDDQGRWVKSAFEIRGSSVEYRLQPPGQRAENAP